MNDIQINLICCTDTILGELESGLSRKSVALSYAMAMKSAAQKADAPDWPKINHAILAKWGPKGLESVKKRAWQILEGKIDPSSAARPSRHTRNRK